MQAAFVPVALICILALPMCRPLLAAPAIDGSEIIFNVSGSETYSEQIPSTCTKVIKKGAGTLTLSGNSSDFHGDVEIREGIVVASHMNALGRGSGDKGTTSPNTISVSPDAQLRATFGADRSDGNTEGRGFRSVIEVAGIGPDGKGAFFYDAPSSSEIPYWFIWKLKLVDDATIGGTVGYFARTLDLNTKTLTVKIEGDKNPLPFYYMPTSGIMNPGSMVVDGGVRIWGSDFGGGKENLLTFSGSTLYLTAASPIGWSVNWSNISNGTIENNAGGYDGSLNLFNGDFRFGGTRLLAWPQQNCGISFGGKFIAENGYLEKGGPGIMRLGGIENFAQKVIVNGGTLAVSGSAVNVAGCLQIDDGAMVRFEDAGDVVMTNWSSIVRSKLGVAPSRLELSGATSFRNKAYATYLYAGLSPDVAEGGVDRRWGTVSVDSGVVMSNNFAVGYNGIGAVYQKGGNIYWNSYDRTYAGYLGCSPYAGYGYWGMKGGTLTIPRFVELAGGHSDSTAFFVQTGGLATLNGEDLKISTRGHANMYIGDGAVFSQTAGSTYMGYTDGTMGVGGDAAVTVDGTGSTFKAAWFVGMQNRTNFTSYVNMNGGGALEAFQIVNSFGSSWTWPNGSKQYISFNGGVWRTPPGMDGAHDAFYSASVEKGTPDALLCHSGGAIFDTQSSSVRLNAPLIAPSGRTVKSITLPADADFVAATNIGPARISIEGSGFGATAFAPFDDEAGRLRGDVIITSPGSGYGDDTVIRVYSHDGHKSWTCAYELEDAVSGGLTKLGAGTLQLKCANTYRGKTVVKQGMLDMAVASGIPDGNALEVASGATLVLSGNLKVTELSGAGQISGGKDKALTVDGSLVLDSSNMTDGGTLSASGSINFGEGALLKVADEDLLTTAPKKLTLITAGYIWGVPTPASDFGGRWTASRSSDGKSLTLRYLNGMVISVR